MYKNVLMLTISVLFAFNLQAAEPTKAAPDQKDALVTKLFELTKRQQTYETTASRYLQTLTERPGLTDHQFIMNYSKQMSWNSVKDEMAKITKEAYTTEELEGIIAFLKTDAGKAFMNKGPKASKKIREYVVDKVKKLQNTYKP